MKTVHFTIKTELLYTTLRPRPQLVVAYLLFSVFSFERMTIIVTYPAAVKIE
jgi:hypothetical protein